MTHTFREIYKPNPAHGPVVGIVQFRDKVLIAQANGPLLELEYDEASDEYGAKEVPGI